MSIEFRLDKKEKTILIVVVGDVTVDDLRNMRNHTVELLKETGIENFIVDLSALDSILEQDTFITYKLGKEFQDVNFPITAKTAIILPTNNDVLQQVKFLHTVEINRMRGPIEYVTSYEDALAWFHS